MQAKMMPSQRNTMGKSPWVSTSTGARTMLRSDAPTVEAHRMMPAGAVDRHQLAPVKVEFAAKPNEVAEHLPERVPVVAPEVRDRLEVRPKPAQQPDHFKIAVCLDLQATARADAVQIVP